MLRFLPVALAVCLFAAPTFAVEPPKEPKTFTSAKQGTITFKHDSKAHKEQKCEKCHGEGAPGKIAALEGGGPAAMKAGHATCQACHKEKDPAKAKCEFCHKK